MPGVEHRPQSAADALDSDTKLRATTAVRLLDQMDAQGPLPPEEARYEATQILLACVPVAVREAYLALRRRKGYWTHN